MKKLFTIIAVLLCLSLDLFAQNITVTGTVKDVSGTLPGVSITIKGVGKGTQTNAEGKFSISAPPDETLVFSYIGYQIKEVPINNQTVLNVQLEPSSKELEQV